METNRTATTPDARLTNELLIRVDSVHITRAAAVAAAAHAGQTRQYSNVPYINHPLRVAAKAADMGLSTEAVVAAILHDVREDTDTTMDELEAQDFPPRTLLLVSLLTKPIDYPALRGDPEAAVLKVLDRLDNLMDLHGLLIDPQTYLRGRLPNIRSWAQRYVLASERDVTPLLDTPLVTPFLAELYRSLIDAVNTATARKIAGS